jgi:hypothetical protein
MGSERTGASKTRNQRSPPMPQSYFDKRLSRDRRFLAAVAAGYNYERRKTCYAVHFRFEIELAEVSSKREAENVCIRRHAEQLRNQSAR